MPPTPPLSAPRISTTSTDHRSPGQESRGSLSAGEPPSAYDQRVEHRTSSDSRASSSRQPAATAAYQQPSPNNVPAFVLPNISASSFSAVPAASSLPVAQPSSLEEEAPPPPPKPDFVRRGSSTPAPVTPYTPANGLPYEQQGTPRASSPMLPSALYAQSPERTRLAIHDAQLLQSQRSHSDLQAGPPQTEAQLQAAMSRAKWQAEEQAAASPQRSQAPVRVDLAAFAEAERLKREKEFSDRAQVDAEEQRRLQWEEARRLEATQRLKLEEARRSAETKRKLEEAERRATLEIQRQEEMQHQQRRLDEAEHIRRRAEDEKRLQRERWMAERASMEQKFKQLQVAGEVMLTGWASHQVGVIWRRRHFELRPDCLLLFKNAEEKTRPVAALSTCDIQDITDARDDLQLPHSLRVDFKGLDPSYFYCDSQEDKEVFVAALRQAARL